MTKTPHRIVLLLLVLALAAGACSKKNEVGSGLDASKIKNTNCRIGECTTTTTAPPATTTTAKTTATTAAAKATTTTARPATTTTVATVNVSITASGFEPPNVRIYVGQRVVYTNADSQTRSVQDNNGAFSSGDLAPGKSWTFTGTRAAKYDISDGTRPFVVGSIEVLQR
jgi:plastocyanin